jgi:hypothetical protein
MNAAVAVTQDQTVYVVYDGDLDPEGRSSIYVRTRREGLWSTQRRVGPAGLDAQMPTVTVDAAGGLHTLYHDIEGGQIYHATSADWDGAVPVTQTGRNRSPSFAPPGSSGDSDLAYVWTVLDAEPENRWGANRIRYASLVR